MCDPMIHIHKTVLMQRLMDAVVRGYIWYTNGTIPLKNAARLAAKFAGKYATNRNSNQRAYAKRKGRANTRLFMFYSDTDPVVQWWLLTTEGDGEIHDEEKLQDCRVRRHRIRIKKEYELVRVTKSGIATTGGTWTWRMTSWHYNNWRQRILSVCRGSSPVNATRALGSLVRTPGFYGNRVQVGRLLALLRSEWRRRHGSTDLLPGPLRLGYIERVNDTSIPWSSLIRGIEQQ